MTELQLVDKARGSLTGGAAGDALGYAVEFDRLDKILGKYGQGGIGCYELSGGLALVSDDTQMTLFTAEGLINAAKAGAATITETLPHITRAYLNWYVTQREWTPRSLEGSEIAQTKELWSRRAPGITCMTALQALSLQATVSNTSKGCGGVMRAAPIGIFAASHPDRLRVDDAGLLAGMAADITHKHPLSTYSSSALAMIVAECMAQDKVTREEFRRIVIDKVMMRLAAEYKEDRYIALLQELLEKALDLATSDLSDFDCIAKLGEGWVAEETLAIAVFSAMRYIDDFSRCLTCAVNHDGDSDSTGAVAGNIIGAIQGYGAMPDEFKDNLELHDLILNMADQLVKI